MVHSHNIEIYTNTLTFLIEELENVSAKRDNLGEIRETLMKRLERRQLRVIKLEERAAEVRALESRIKRTKKKVSELNDQISQIDFPVFACHYFMRNTLFISRTSSHNVMKLYR